MTNDIKAIADGLSEAQRAAFLRSDPAKMHQDWWGRISTYSDAQVGNELFALRLITRPGTFALATPLGLQVRDYLLKEKAS